MDKGGFRGHWGDLDHDGDIDDDDARTLLEFALALRSGVPVLPLADSKDSKGGYTAGDFYRQFDGLGYEEILSRADPRIIQRYSAYLIGRSQAQMNELARLNGTVEPTFGGWNY